MPLLFQTCSCHDIAEKLALSNNHSLTDTLVFQVRKKWLFYEWTIWREKKVEILFQLIV
jgi:hypothetical protein